MTGKKALMVALGVGLAAVVSTVSAALGHRADVRRAMETAEPVSPVTDLDCSEFADSYLTESDHGRELELVETSRFGFCLDAEVHPLKDLDISGCPIGAISNWSLRGPRVYPVGFEVTGEGSCKVRNREYWVRIVAIPDDQAHPSE